MVAVYISERDMQLFMAILTSAFFLADAASVAHVLFWGHDALYSCDDSLAVDDPSVVAFGALPAVATQPALNPLATEWHPEKPRAQEEVKSTLNPLASEWCPWQPP